VLFRSVNYIALTFCWYQPNVDAVGPIYPRAGVSPQDAEITSILSYAHAHGVSVMMRPCVDPDWSKPGTAGTWRGMIGRYYSAADWATWFAAYQPFLYRYATLAQSLKFDSLCVGMELEMASLQTELWRETVLGVRNRYAGPLLYAANWGNEGNVQWWDAVDVIGVDAYYPLAPTNTNPAVQDLISAWGPITSSLAALSSKTGKNVVFAEIGYCANNAANVDPAHCNTLGYCDQCQANLYQAVLQSVYLQPWFEGLYFWAWLSNPDDSGTGAELFTPHGRGASAVMTSFFKH